MFLASALLAEAASGHVVSARNSWRGPDPFAPYANVRTLRPAAGERARLQGARVVWMHSNGAESFALLFIACLCLVTLEMRIMRGSTGKQERLATILAGALRSGALEFDGGARAAVPSLGHNWMDPDETDGHEPVAPEPERIMSRYTLLAYGGGRRDPMKSEEESISFLGVKEENFQVIRDEDLLLGIPREFLRPELLEQAESIHPRLAIAAGSADGDDPGESATPSHPSE